MEEKLREVENSIRKVKYDESKFRQVILYVIKKLGYRPDFDLNMLHNMLYFIDFDYYEKYEESLMGATYIK